jgi:hypothetical protein
LIDVAGPDNLTDLEVVRLYERLTGKTASVRRVPLLIVRIASRLARPLHPGLSQVLRMAALARLHGQTADSASVVKRIGFEPMRLEKWAVERLMMESAPRCLRGPPPGRLKQSSAGRRVTRVEGVTGRRGIGLRFTVPRTDPDRGRVCV